MERKTTKLKKVSPLFVLLDGVQENNGNTVYNKDNSHVDCFVVKKADKIRVFLKNIGEVPVLKCSIEDECDFEQDIKPNEIKEFEIDINESKEIKVRYYCEDFERYQQIIKLEVLDDTVIFTIIYDSEPDNEYKQKVLDSLIKEAKREGIVDFMEMVTPETLGMTKFDFSAALYRLQKEGCISKVDFEPENNCNAVMWDRITINTDDFKFQ